ncbi:MAG: hypothetical protein Q6365_015860 [Candidatus Sigynarchaeota archaeon]
MRCWASGEMVVPGDGFEPSGAALSWQCRSGWASRVRVRRGRSRGKIGSRRRTLTVVFQVMGLAD